MITVRSFAFNPFSENSYVLSDETKQCVIIDPGCYTPDEKKELAEYIEDNKLQPVKLLNTHCHIDHVLGNKFVSEKYKIALEMNEKDLMNLHALKSVSEMYNIPCELSPEPKVFLNEGDVVHFGNSALDVIFAPGHSSGSIVFYSVENKLAISGDVLFYQSIGRYDFPGGNYETLISSIKDKLFLLPDETKIYSGHGPMTTIGFEKRNNPFLNE